MEPGRISALCIYKVRAACRSVNFSSGDSNFRHSRSDGQRRNNESTHLTCSVFGTGQKAIPPKPGSVVTSLLPNIGSGVLVYDPTPGIPPPRGKEVSAYSSTEYVSS